MTEPETPEGFTSTKEIYAYPDYSELEGRIVASISANTECINLYFEDGTSLGLVVSGDCCSHSYWHDLIGVNHLLEGARIVKCQEMLLGEREIEPYCEYTKAYALKIVSEHPVWGEVTTIFAFRNDSNGYYGGECTVGPILDGTWPVTGDVLNVAELEYG